MSFWDSSALLPLWVDEPRSDGLRQLAEERYDWVVWWGTRVECASALARRKRDLGERAQLLTPAEELLQLLSKSWTEVLPTEALRTLAERLLRIHPLRAADALQLAAALVWADNTPSGLEFVCLDQRLREAAQREGFLLLPD